MDSVFTAAALLHLSVWLPLLAALLLLVRPLRPYVAAAAPWTAAPALVAALWIEPGTYADAPWLLLGMRLGVDDTARVFLLFTAALWIVCGQYARAVGAAARGRERFWAPFLLTLAGNVGVVLAGDAITFYSFFAVMSFASYGLVVYEGGSEARRAGAIYLAFIAAGEVLLFVGIVGTVAMAGSAELRALGEAELREPFGIVVLVCLLAGFGIKAGAVPLHMSLPVAYSAAPIAAAAALAGPMINAGVLGWLRFLPLGDAAFPVAGMACIASGLAGALGGVVAGLAQRDAKVVLAYSSISHMGLVTVGVGVGLWWPAAWASILPAIWLYALHHAAAKTALFLGLGVAESAVTGARARRFVMAGLVLAAAVLAGVPFSSGAGAKHALKDALASAPIPSGLVDLLLAGVAVGTTLLMARTLRIAGRREPRPASRPAAGIWIPWLVSLAATVLAAWLLPWAGVRRALLDSVAPQYLWAAAWPAGLGAGLAWAAWRWAAFSDRASRIHIPPGDILVGLLRMLGRARVLADQRQSASAPVVLPSAHRVYLPVAEAFSRYAVRAERALERWDVIGLLVLALVAALLVSFGS